MIIDYKLNGNGNWEQLIAYDNGKTKWCGCVITDVPVEKLLISWEFLVAELSLKEIALCKLKEEYDKKEFDIVYNSDIDFKALYGSTSEKVRKQHAKDMLIDLSKEIDSLELSIKWIKNYIPLIRHCLSL
jgi:hypothetical protein